MVTYPADSRRYPRATASPYHANATYQPRDRRGHIMGSSIHDSRTSIMTQESEVDDSQSSRKRIAVACGRCRKRKIRCSGDSGNGQPCQNCHNAGVDPCEFLRVASTHASWKDSNINHFTYNLDSARTFQARPVSIGHGYATTDAADYYRSAPYAGYGKPYYPMVTASTDGLVGAYPTDAVDYTTMYASNYPHTSSIGHDGTNGGYGMTYRAGAASRHAALYPETTDAGYPYASQRSNATASDAPNYGLNTMAASLNPSLGSNGERILPMPVSRALGSNTSCAAAYHSDYPTSSHRGSTSQTSSTSSSTSPTSPISDANTGYTSYDGSPTLAATYQSDSVPHRPSETYSSARADVSTESLYAGSQCSTPTDVPYRMTNPAEVASRRNSAGSSVGTSGYSRTSSLMHHGVSSYMLSNSSGELTPASSEGDRRSPSGVGIHRGSLHN